jgi:hypothetical protein
MVDKPSNPLHLNEKEYRAMLDISERYFSEAKRCRAGKAYLAGIVMVGAALETILMCMVCCDSKKIAAWDGAPEWRHELKPLRRWSMTELMDAAEFAGWLPKALRGSAWDSGRALPGDYAEVLRQFRNLVHPNRYLQHFPHERFSKKLLNRLLNIYAGAIFPQFDEIASPSSPAQQLALLKGRTK